MPLDFQKWHIEQMRNRPRSRWSARLLGLAILLAIIAVAIVPFIPVKDPDSIGNSWLFIWPSVFGAGLSPFGAMWLGSKMSKQYDEFETAALAKATNNAYFLLLLFCLMLILWCGLASATRIAAPSRLFDWSIVFMAMISLGVSLPTFIAEMTIPFPPANEGDSE